MAAKSARRPPRHFRAPDARGIAQLATQATAGVASIAGGVHRSVMRTIGVRDPVPSDNVTGITGLAYKSVHGVTRLVGKGVDQMLARVESSFGSTDDSAASPQREAVIAALNGVMGDHLVASDSPFATPMTLRYRGSDIDLAAMPAVPDATGKLLLLVHGLCLSDRNWHTRRRGRIVDHGEVLAAALGYTPVYLRYNSGLHTSENGRELSAQLESLVARWPVAIDDLAVVAHSMGGLVIRSACHYATADALRWPGLLTHLVFLGTPHHGAPLERAGNRVDVILGSTPYTAPLAALGQLRSAGITDLRYGHVVDEDWLGRDRFHRADDSRRIVPLPAGAACHTAAATRAARLGSLSERLIGDGLVPVPSALGQHPDARRCLAFETSSKWIAYRTNHMQLLGSSTVSRQLVKWLTPKPDTP